MKVTKLSDKIILFEFPTIKELTLTFYRFAEFYEGVDGIKGQYFTFDEFVDKYSDDKGNIDYFSKWEGFNFPIQTLREFMNYFDCFAITDLSKREREIIENVELGNSGYIIACVEGDEITRRHELSHAKYYLDKEYKEKSLEVIKTLPDALYARLRNDLKKQHYCDEVIDDEIVSYLVAWNDKDQKEVFHDINFEEIGEFKIKLDKLYGNKAIR